MNIPSVNISTKIDQIKERKALLLEEKNSVENRIEKIYDLGNKPSADHFEKLIRISKEITKIDATLSEIHRLLKLIEVLENQVYSNINTALTNCINE